jgi:Flp pilus assembly protein TadG
MRSLAKALLGEESGAVASLYALALPALIVAGGIAFDYARLASMDTELQNAADQAALAAATQLDQAAGSCARASSAAVTLVTNNTLFANETGGARAVTITGVADCVFAAGEKIRFWQDKDKTTAATSDANARFVEVTVDARTARYALTPIVGVFNSGAIDATALAGLGSAICKVPPVMICNPDEATDPTFTAGNYVGKGLKLVSVGNGGGAWSAGNFGYLNTGGGSNGAPGLREALGWTVAPGDCLEQTGVDTKPGASVSVTDALNTRFDIYDGNNSCETGGLCPPSINSVKDLLRAENANGNNACRMQNAGWQEAAADKRYMPNLTDALTPSTLTPDSMGHPRDMCHAAVSTAANYCAGPIGTGQWDRDTYFRANYGWTPSEWQANIALGVNPITTTTPTRYRVYQWEIDNRGTTIGGQGILPLTANSRAIGSMRDHDRPICGALQTPSYGDGYIPGPATVDRRRLSVAVVNCSNGDEGTPVNGASTNVTVIKWIEVFLVEPSFNRSTETESGGTPAHARSGTGTGDIYVEVIAETLAGTAGSTAGQVVRRDLPYLIQ